MKAIQIMMEERLLEALDRDEEVIRNGRSAVFRGIVREYVDRRRRDSISGAYRKAYGDRNGIGSEFTGWEDEGSWPQE